MKLECYTVFDRAVGAFMPPFFAKSHGEALRMFMDAVNSKDSLLSKHPADYMLYACGTFDDANGTFNPDEPVKLLSAVEAITQDDNVVEIKRA